MKEKLSAIKTWFLSYPLKKKLAVIAILAVLGWVGYSKIKENSATKPQYQTTKAAKGEIISTVSESGNISVSQTNVTSPSNGVIEEVFVKNGDDVASGQNLFRVKSSATAQEKAAAYASYLSALNSLNSAKSRMNSLQSALFKANQAFITDRGVDNPSDSQKADPRYIEENAEWLQAESDYNNQTGVISQAQVSYTSASYNYQATQDSIVTAPTAGTVANLSAIVGGTVSAGSTTSTTSNGSTSTTTSGGSTVLVITNFNTLQMKVQASEIDVPKLKSGQKATITLDSLPDKTFVGSVVSVDTIGTNSSGVVTYNVYITFAYPPPGVSPGMSASVVIQTERKDNVLKIPSSAVLSTTGQATVRILKNGTVTSVPVETGISSDSETEITTGISEGDIVVTSVSTGTGTGGSTTSPFSAFGAGRGFGGGGGAVFRAGGGGGR
jgi:macrolide-specific efflux system membrane fusion protein